MPVVLSEGLHGVPLQGPEAGHRPPLRVELGLDCQVRDTVTPPPIPGSKYI